MKSMCAETHRQQRVTIRQHQQRYSEAISEARSKGIDSFHSWFNQSESRLESYVQGYWDFSVHILTPRVCELLEHPQSKTALEIGYGGGRLLNAASSHFKFAIGVDIHSESKFVEADLNELGRTNFRLLSSNGSSLDVEDDSIDFIYSFIVLQHLPTVDILKTYLHESHRVLKRGGVAQLYYGKFTKLPLPDRLKCFLIGYKEIPDAPVNHTSLVVRAPTMARYCRQAGFRVVDKGTSYKKVPDGFATKPGGQEYVTLLKK